MFDTREPKTGPGPSPKPKTPTPTTPPRPLKANQQRWERTFRGAAKGVTFQLRIIRRPDGHLSARYQATPGKGSGWHLEGQLREDNTFTLKGTENNAEFQGSLNGSGELITAKFKNEKDGKIFSVSSLKLTRILRPTVQKTKIPIAPDEISATSVSTDMPAKNSTDSSGPSSELGYVYSANKTGLKGFDGNVEIQRAILWGASKLSIDPNDLAAVIGYETMGTFSPQVENAKAKAEGREGAVGLIQFTKSDGIPAINQFLKTKSGASLAQDLEITITPVSRADLLKMSPMEQMKYVVLYFNIELNKIKPGENYAGLYQEILAPARESEIWYDSSKASDKVKYEANQQFDNLPKDGKITQFEAAGEIRRQGYAVNYFNSTTKSQKNASKLTESNSGTLSSINSTKTNRPQENQIPQTSSIDSTEDKISASITKILNDFNFTTVVDWTENGSKKERVLRIRTPYFINIGDMLTIVKKNRSQMSQLDRKAFSFADFAMLAGKASPDDMKAFTDNLVKVNPFGKHPKNITASDITSWLKRYGIGVDCSGFVTQALDNATTTLTGVDPKIGNENVRVNTGSGALKGGQGVFGRVMSPKSVKAGDTMWLSGHIRIVIKSGPAPDGKGIQMLIAESTPNEQMPASAATGGVYRIGVDASIWYFPNPDSFTRSGVKKKINNYNWESSSDDKWVQPNTLNIEQFVFGRYKPLDKARQK
ncbi:hypothetical protein [Deinococcus depolymerans]|uniref:Transglycosylase SLT domain-containing protein n=1 Tax=Deinococcus depolymerans TaxID=392408 RepID=A0ABP3LP35_9DEIO